MPIYTFRHRKTGKEIVKMMTIAEGEAFEKKHPNYSWLCGLPVIGDPWRLGQGKKPSEGFSARLKQIKKMHNTKGIPSTINER